MGKVSGIFGTATGKVGNVVFAKGEDGQTVARAYQPTVANPRTDGQLLQRAKINLAGQISAITPREVLTGISNGSARVDRSTFLRKLIEATTSTMTADGANAAIDPAAIVFSVGIVAMKGALADVAINASGMTGRMALTNAAFANRTGVRVIVAVVRKSQRNVFQEVAYNDYILATAEGINVSVPFSTEVTEENIFYVYTVPFDLTESGRRLVANRMEGDNAEITALLARNIGESADFGASRYVGVFPFGS